MSDLRHLSAMGIFEGMIDGADDRGYGLDDAIDEVTVAGCEMKTGKKCPYCGTLLAEPLSAMTYCPSCDNRCWKIVDGVGHITYVTNEEFDRIIHTPLKT